MPGTITQSKKIIVVLLAFAVLAFLPSGQACAAAKSYKDAKHGFSFSYPEKWVNSSFIVDSVKVSSQQADDISATFSVNVLPPFEWAEITEDALVETYKTIMDDVEMLSYKVIKLNGVPCVAADMIYASGKRKLRVRQQMYMANNKGKGYMLVSAAISKDYGKCEDSFKMILDSFKF